MAGLLAKLGKNLLPRIKVSSNIHNALKNSNWQETFRCYTSIATKFEEAKLRLNTLNNDPGNQVKLQMYALFKQATIGKNETSKPGALNFVGQAKWNAWNDLGQMSKEDAMQKYVDIVDDLERSENPGATKENDVQPVGSYNTDGFTVNTENKVTTITLNRPEKKNALTVDMYKQLQACLEHCATDDSTSVVLLTGAGDYFCSGNDLNNFMNIDPSNMQKVAEDSGELLRNYVGAYIDFPKPLIAAVNGPAIGVSVTVLGLFDTVYASDKATFSTPFSTLGQSPEGASSFTFPMIMGHNRACNLMLFNQKLNANEAKDCGLVTKIIPHSRFHDTVQQEVEKIAKLPIKSLVYSKELMRSPLKDKLHDANKRECVRLVERWTSEDCMNAIMQFFAAKK